MDTIHEVNEMIFAEKTVVLKTGKEALFRSPVSEDAEGMLAYLKTCASETNFILRCPEECVETVAQEEKFLEHINESDTGIMIVCLVDGEIAGNCQLAFNKRIKTRHRASVAIGLIRKYWGLGIGTAMFNEMIDIARDRGILQLELSYIEGNERAKALYEKMGFSQVAVMPDAIRLKDGTLLDEIYMQMKLQ